MNREESELSLVNLYGRQWLNDMRKHVATTPMHLDLRELLVGDINRLRYVDRYDNSLVMHKENVAEHCYYVAVYAMFLAEYAESRGHKVDAVAVMYRALFHDVDEAFSGDIHRPFKHADSRLRHLIKEVAGKFVRDMFTKLLGGDSYRGAVLHAGWLQAKDEFLEGSIVELADYMAVVGYLWQEASATTNGMMMHYETMQEHIAYFRSEPFEVFSELVEYLNDVVTRIYEKVRKGSEL